MNQNVLHRVSVCLNFIEWKAKAIDMGGGLFVSFALDRICESMNIYDGVIS